MSRRWTMLAVIVPVLGLALLTVRAELAVRSGTVWTVPIEGFDPRDLLHGQYLRYQYTLRWNGTDTCGPGFEDEHELVEGCCLCLTRGADGGYDPWVRQVGCDEALACDGHVRSVTMQPPLRYFVPEERARDLEAALRIHDAAIELTASREGTPAVRELVLDRRPWRDVLR